MSWSWRYEKSDGTPAASAELPAESFPTRADAETWLGEAWRDLLEAGADQVVLMQDDRVEYGPMSLHSPADGG